MRGTIFGAIGARLGTALGSRYVRGEPAPWRRPRAERRGLVRHDVHVVAVARRPGEAGDRRVRRGIDLVLGPRDDLGGGRLPGFVLHPRRHARALGACPTGAATTWTRWPRRWSPRWATWCTLPVAVPRDVPRPQRRRERRGRGALCIVLCVLARVRAWATRDAQVRRDRAGDDRGDRADAVARHPRRRAAAGARPGLERLAGALILIPPFVSQAGALGGILSSRLSSKLQLGVITPRGLPERPAVLDASIVVALGAVIFTFDRRGRARVWPICSGMAHPAPGADGGRHHARRAARDAADPGDRVLPRDASRLGSDWTRTTTPSRSSPA